MTTSDNINSDTAVTLTSNGIALDTSPEKFGELRDSMDIVDDVAAQRARMADEGYLFFRGLMSREEVLAARHEILLKYATAGEIDSINHPLMDAIYSENSFIDKINLRAFTESIRTGLAYENVALNKKVIGFYEKFFDDAVHPYDFRWPRFVRPSEGCGFHYDGPYMNRGTDRVYTSWIPLGDVAKTEGALIVLENSHKSDELLSSYAKKDADKEKIGWLSTNPIKLQERFGGRWLSTDFQAGDMLCFTMHTLHGALDNNSPIKRCRLTSDTRYQPASEPIDERWNGAKPEAHGYDKVFLPGLGAWNNQEFQDEWKLVDDYGRLVLK
ncbi:MAG: phytanoyl-CoA dioxygenase family protein [Chloroflexota bacterium]